MSLLQVLRRGPGRLLGEAPVTHACTHTRTHTAPGPLVIPKQLCEVSKVGLGRRLGKWTSSKLRLPVWSCGTGLSVHYLIYLVLTCVLLTIILTTAVSRVLTLCQGFSTFYRRFSWDFNPQGGKHSAQAHRLRGWTSQSVPEDLRGLSFPPLLASLPASHSLCFLKTPPK